MFGRVVVALGLAASLVSPFGRPAQAYTLGQLVSTAEAPASAVLHSVEVRAETTPQINQWRHVVRTMQTSHPLEACLAEAGRCPGGNGRAWRAMMDEARGGTVAAQIAAVNGFFNRLPYRSDREEYGTSDHWATPVELLSRGAGDCEDYAVAKFFSLKLLGVADHDLRVVAVWDRLAGIGHSVLTVAMGGTRYVLDNRSDRVLPESLYRHYEPLLSMNESGAWRDLWRAPRQAASLASIDAALTFH